MQQRHRVEQGATLSLELFVFTCGNGADAKRARGRGAHALRRGKKNARQSWRMKSTFPARTGAILSRVGPGWRRRQRGRRKFVSGSYSFVRIPSPRGSGSRPTAKQKVPQHQDPDDDRYRRAGIPGGVVCELRESVHDRREARERAVLTEGLSDEQPRDHLTHAGVLRTPRIGSVVDGGCIVARTRPFGVAHGDAGENGVHKRRNEENGDERRRLEFAWSRPAVRQSIRTSPFRLRVLRCSVVNSKSPPPPSGPAPISPTPDRIRPARRPAVSPRRRFR
jgi:hypothetical protein